MENFQSIISLSEFFLLAVGNTACKQLVYITWFIFIKFRWGILIYSIEIWKKNSSLLFVLVHLFAHQSDYCSCWQDSPNNLEAHGAWTKLPLAVS